MRNKTANELTNLFFFFFRWSFKSTSHVHDKVPRKLNSVFPPCSLQNYHLVYCPLRVTNRQALYPDFIGKRVVMLIIALRVSHPSSGKQPQQSWYYIYYMEIIKAVIKATKPEHGKSIFSSCHLSGKIPMTPVPYQFSSVQSLSRVWLFATPWTAAHQAFLSITNSQSLLKLMSIGSVMQSSHLILCHPLLLPPSIFPSIRVFSNESVLCIRWPQYWSFSFNISPDPDVLPPPE